MFKFIEEVITAVFESLVLNLIASLGWPEPPKAVQKLLKFIVSVLYIVFIVFMILIGMAAISEGDTGMGIAAFVLMALLIVITGVKVSKNKKK